MPVVAAGAILWRKEKGELRVLMIHRSRYDDWSWPKGKLDKGEAVSEAAVREIKEETGLKVYLGVKLFVSEYKLDNGSKKRVHYWAAQVTDEALKKQQFKPDDEVSTFEWLSVTDAKKRMTYKHDNDPLKALIALNDKNQLDTRPFIVLRHAKATTRSDWAKGEATRPLLKQGTAQAVALTNILNAYGPKLVVTSRWKRCLDTVHPFISKHKIKLVERSQLSELGAKNGPQRTHKLINNLVETYKRVVVCSHRPALPTIVEALGVYGDKAQRKELEEALILKPGDMCVVHLAKGIGKKEAKIIGIEFEGPASWD
jgi:8-oxo-dGTP diphosphatase